MNDSISRTTVETFANRLVSHLRSTPIPEFKELKYSAHTVHLKYDENFKPQPQISYQKIPVKTLSFPLTHQLAEAIKTTEYYMVFQKEIAGIENPENFLNEFSRAIISEFQLDKENLNSVIEEFVSIAHAELTRQLYEYTLRFTVRGFYIEADIFETQIGELKFKVRKYTEATLRDDLNYNNEGHNSWSDNFIHNDQTGTALEYTLPSDVNFFFKLNQINYYFMMLLPLFKACDIKQLGCRAITKTFVSPNTFAGSNKNYPKKDASLLNNEHAVFTAFIKNFVYIDGSAVPPGFSSSDAIIIAHTRYIDSLNDFDNFEKSLATQVMALEALFTEGGDNLNYKLSLRVAKLFYDLDIGNLDVKKAISLAYKIRSNFVHGTKNSEREQKEIVKLGFDQLEFQKLITSIIRICLNIYLLLKIEKRAVIDRLDTGMITGEKSISADELKLLRECCIMQLSV